jgi:CheY-like chemotaxis protein
MLYVECTTRPRESDPMPNDSRTANGDDIHDESAAAFRKAEQVFVSFEPQSANQARFGLSLPIARESVEAIGDAVRIRGIPDEGCVFTIDLQRPPASAVISGLTVVARTGQGRKSRVLIAEDDDDQRDAIASAIRAIDIEADVVADGGRFLVAVASQYRVGAETRPIDLMVVDVFMPVCGGLAILEALRTARWVTPVVVITGRETQAVRSATERLGGTLMIKPLDMTTLQQTVLRLLAECPA